MAEVIKTPPKSKSTRYIDSSPLKGCYLLADQMFTDNRGMFRKVLPSKSESTLSNFSVEQANISVNSLAGTIRGMHYQIAPDLESKTVSCIQGQVMDVLLDMRPNSETFGKFTYFHLTPASGTLVIPPLIAHGFQTLEDSTILLYLHSKEYKFESSKSINPLDASLGISWPLSVRSISETDKNSPSFSEVMDAHREM